MGEQRNPGDSTSFLVPQVQTPVGSWPIGSIGDYFGLTTVGQVSAGKSVTHSALPFRAYNSRFNVQTSHKTTFDAGKLIPIYVDEVLPGDTFSLSCTAFGRLATPIFPIMDNLHMDTFFFCRPIVTGKQIGRASCRERV